MWVYRVIRYMVLLQPFLMFLNFITIDSVLHDDPPSAGTACKAHFLFLLILFKIRIYSGFACSKSA